MKPLQHRARHTAVLAVLLSTIAVFHFATIRDGLRWGDNAQYLHHAKNLALGRPYTETGYVYCKYVPQVGPQSYPPGWPCLLAPLYYVFGLSFNAYKYLVVAFLVGLVGLAYFLCGSSRPATSGIMTAILLGFNPWLVNAKQSIGSDVPFTCCLLGALVWHDRTFRRGVFGWGQTVIAIALSCSVCMLRTPGLLLIPALLAYDIVTNKQVSQFTIKVCLGTLVITFLIRALTGLESGYVDQLSNYNPLTPLANVRYYAGDLALEFWAPIPGVPYSRKTIFVFMGICAIIGLTRTWRLGATLGEYFLIPYLALILVWPSRQDVRFLLPLIPLYLRYACIGIQAILPHLRLGALHRAVWTLVILVLFVSYVPRLSEAWTKRGLPLPDGVHVPEVRELFTYVREHSDAESVLVFRKPRALALLAERKATVFPWGQSDEVALQYFADVRVTHLVIDHNDKRDNDLLTPFVRRHQESIRDVFHNSRYTVFAVFHRE